MKMKILDRLVMRLFGVLAVICGLMLFLVPFQVLGTMEYRFPWVRWLFWGGGLLTALIGLYILLVPHRYRYSKKDFILRRTENGDMHISIRAMETQVQKCVDLHKEIRMHAMRIVNTREGVNVEMKVSLASNISIPLSIESLQKQVKQYLLASTGVEIRQVRIEVISTQGEVDDTPYRFDDQQAARNVESEAPAEEEKKVPVHRRIFGLGDRVQLNAEKETEAEAVAEQQPLPVENTEMERMSDAAETDAGADEAFEAENLNETDAADEAERVSDAAEETAEAEETDEENGEVPEVLPEVEL